MQELHQRTDLLLADASAADLRGANLGGANLAGTQLQGALIEMHFKRESEMWGHQGQPEWVETVPIDQEGKLVTEE